MVAAIALATVSAASEAGVVLCLAEGGHVAVESQALEPAFVEALGESQPAHATDSPSADSSCQFHRHGRCVDLSLNPGLALPSQERASVPAAPVLAQGAAEIFRNRDSSPNVPQRAKPSRFALTRTPILRC